MNSKVLFSRKRVALNALAAIICASLSIYSFAQTEGNHTYCLEVDPLEKKHGETKGKACYREVTGDDLLEGYVTTCYVDNGRDCQPKKCLSQKGCYTQ